MANRQKGFIPPTHADIPEDVCMLVFVPNDVHAIAAFWGQYEDLGLWTTWAKTGDTRARDIAFRFKQSIIESLDLWEEIGCMSPLTVNVNCCCDSTPGTSGSTIIINNVIHLGSADYEDIVGLPGGVIDDGYSPPTSDWPNRTEYEQYKCNYAATFANDLVDTFMALAIWHSGFAEWTYDQIELMLTTANLSSLIKGLIAPVFTEAGYLDRLKSALLQMAEDDPIKFVTAVDVAELLVKDYIKCLIYNANSADQARSNILEMFESTMADAGLGDGPIDSFTKYEMRAWFALLVDWTNLEPAFDLAQVAETFAGAYCGDCTGAPILPGPNTLQTGLISYYEFETDAVLEDSHGDHDWTSAGAQVTGGEGITGQCVFNNTQDAKFLAMETNVWQALGSWSVAFWAAPTATPPAADSDILFEMDGRVTIQWQYNQTQLITIVEPASGGTNYPSMVDDWQLNTWNLVVVTYNHSTYEFTRYMNDADPLTSVIATGIIQNALPRLTLGCVYATTYTNAMRGYIDECAFWDRVLTTEEVAALWNVGQGISYDNIVNPGAPA